MKKRMMLALMLLCIAGLLSGCGGTQAPQPTAAPTATPTAESTKAPEITKQPEPTVTEVGQAAAQELPIDLDITGLSAMMVFSSVDSIVNTPDAYIGKRIKARGYYWEMRQPGGEIRRYLVVSDPMACCFPDGAVELQFFMDDESAFEIPSQDQLFEMVGVVEQTFVGKMASGALRAESIVLLDEWLEDSGDA